MNMKDYDITNVPIWFVQAEDDQICTSYTSKMLYDVLQEMGAKNNKITLYSDEEMENAGQHGSWAVALDYYDRFEWLIRTDLRAAIDNLIVERA